MGTRHLTMVVHKKKIRVAQYGQWDGYPSGQGKTVISFVLSKLLFKNDCEKFEQAVGMTKKITAPVLKQMWVECGADPESDTVSFPIADKFHARHPELSRDTGAEVLKIILTKYIGYPDAPILLKDDRAFAGDSLMCEWIWLLDLDTKTLEVYRGFNTKPVPKGERFSSFKSADGADGKYKQCKLWKKIPFDKLTHTTADELDKEYSSDDDENE